ncbi:hypothetical protein [uncultured Roseovarius sp.]|uniref:hypothetical protein n=1 Tax=uncultured Roseovarius sp. TaxID=293344 RepID=UPI002614C4C7|nr:hypothetical protein [uncultured Roseovarius sp.]
MRQLRSALSRLLMVCLVATFVTASVGVGASGAATSGDMPHEIGHAEMPMDEDCPTEADAGLHGQKGHEACAMTVCCFSEGPDLSALSPDFEVIPTPYQPLAERHLTQTEPERAKKPPKHT